MENAVVAALKQRVGKKETITELTTTRTGFSTTNRKARIEEQQRDDALGSCFGAIGQTFVSRRNRESEFLIDEGLHQAYQSENHKSNKQLVVPKRYRRTVFRFAHDGILAGRQGIQKRQPRGSSRNFTSMEFTLTSNGLSSCAMPAQETHRGTSFRGNLWNICHYRDIFSVSGSRHCRIRKTHFRERKSMHFDDGKLRHKIPRCRGTAENTEAKAEGLLKMFLCVSLPR